VKAYKKEFIDFLLANDALKFGEFTLKSGRISPYFLNTGMLHNGEAVLKLGRFYAATIKDNVKEDYNVIFGPAYKGIPLAITTINALYTDYKVNVFYSFNRKEAKDHGDKGVLVGKKLTDGDRIVLIDDVITAGTAIRESLHIIAEESKAVVRAVVLSVDRMEKGRGKRSAIQELSESTGIKFYPIVNILEIMDYLKGQEINGKKNMDQKTLEKMLEYRNKYGAGY